MTSIEILSFLVVYLERGCRYTLGSRRVSLTVQVEQRSISFSDAFELGLAIRCARWLQLGEMEAADSWDLLPITIKPTVCAHQPPTFSTAVTSTIRSASISSIGNGWQSGPSSLAIFPRDR